jgi:hypothetical protein
MRRARGLNLGIGGLRVTIVPESMGLVGRVVSKVRRKLAGPGWCLGLRLSDLNCGLLVAAHQFDIQIGRR